MGRLDINVNTKNVVSWPNRVMPRLGFLVVAVASHFCSCFPAAFAGRLRCPDLMLCSFYSLNAGPRDLTVSLFSFTLGRCRQCSGLGLRTDG